MRTFWSVVTITLLGVVNFAPPAVAQERGAEALARGIAARIATLPGADAAVSFRDLATGDSLDVRGDVSFHAASTMKVPVMIEVLRAADAGRLRLDQEILLVNRFHSIVDGSPYALDAGDDSDSLLYMRVGQRVPVSELLERMITKSSNLATNALIALVGAEQTNATAHALGAAHIQVRRGVEDGKAFEAGLNNTTTSSDLAILLKRIEQHDGLSAGRASLMKEILLRQEHNDGIPAGLPAGTPVAHKTGWITGTLHDAAIVYPPGRAPYVLVILTRNIPKREDAAKLIVDVARLTWAHAMGATQAAVGGAR